MVWRREDPEGNEAGKIKWELVRYTRGRGLDLGCGPAKAFPHFIGVDSCADTELFGTPIKPDIHVQTCEDMSLFGDASMDFVFSSHLLEHIVDYKAALREWWRLVKVGGNLIVYLPHKEFYPNIGQPGSNPDHKHDFMPADIREAMKQVGGWDLLRDESRNDGMEYSFFQVYRKRADSVCAEEIAPVPEKRAAVVRYGAFGDLIQTSSILPGLKAQGFHVTLYTTPRGWDVVSNDPNIDDVVIQDTDQVPNNELPAFWASEARKYQRFINLSESVEGTFLALPGRANHAWPHAVRHKRLNVNYFEFTHELADVPMPPQPRFYPTEAERAWASEERARLGGKKLCMFVLAGSGLHKHWPHMDALIARMLLTYPDLHIVTTGDNLASMLEAGWEEEPRMLLRAGKYTIRQSLALLDQCDMVLGPETGVMNAAGHMDMPKLVWLSHSSVENLTKHWQNTVSLTPENTPCYPCHRMHYGSEHCNMDQELGGAMCQVNISVDYAWLHVVKAMKERVLCQAAA